MKRLLALACALACALAVGTVDTPAHAARPVPTHTVESLGVPLQDVLLLGGAVAPRPDGTGQALWVTSGGKPSHLSALDPLTGALLAAYPLRNATGDGYAEGSYGVTVAPDGSVYVGTYYDGRLYRLRPGPGAQLEDLGQFAQERYLWRVVPDERGRIYGGTYPGGVLFRYDPDTATYHSYGQLVPGVQYVRSVAYHDGIVYAGTQPDAHIVAVDAETGARTPLPLPPGATLTGWSVHDMNVRDGRLYARIGRSISNSTLYVYDLAAGAWVDSIPGVVGLDVTEPDAQGRVYFTISGRGLVSYDPRTRAVTTVVAGNLGNSRGIGWADLKDPAWPGLTLVQGQMRGGLVQYNPTTGRSRTLQSEARGEPIGIWSLSTGAEKVYAGGYLNGGLGVHDPGTGRTTYHRFSQIESILEDGKDLWLGVYPDGRLYRGVASHEFTARQVGTLAGERQMRVPSVVDLGDRVIFGTQGDATTTSGTLTTIDKATQKIVSHPAPVADQGVVALTRRDGLVLGGTSIMGAYSAPAPTADAGTVFAWDAATATTRWSAVPLPGQPAVTGVAVDGADRLWTLTNGLLTAYRPTDGRRLESIRLVPDANAGTLRGDLAYDGTARVLWALVQQRQLWRVDPATGQATLVLERPLGRMALHPGGDVYVSSDAELLRVHPGPRTCPSPQPDWSPRCSRP